MYEVSVEETFAAGHALRGYRGKCEKVHGHNYRVLGVIQGERLDSNGLLVDFVELKRILHAIVERLDHVFLNHLAPFLLTGLLSDTLAGSAPARVVTVSSDAARQGVIDLADLQGLRRRYRPLAIYGDTKLANILFAFELARRLRGAGVTSTCLHPGLVRTHWGSGLGPALRLGVRAAQLAARTPDKGAETVAWLSASAEAEGQTGLFYHDRRAVSAPPAAYDDELAAGLWRQTAQLTGLATP